MDATSPTRPTLVLMGLRGSGKTTLGRSLSARLRLPFVDLDDRTARALAVAHPGDALRLGEPVFRAAEFQSLCEALTEAPGVLALGGGTPTAPGAADVLRDAVARRAIVLIYLRATPATLRARLAETDLSRRPPLLGVDPLVEIAELHLRRDAIYASLASQVIEVDGIDTDAILARLLGMLPTA